MPFSRRDFIASTAGTIGYWAIAGSTNAASIAKRDLRVAVVGVKGRGRSHIDGLKHHVVALCDVDQQVLAERAESLKQELGRSIDTYVDYRQLLDEGEIDAVAIATPNHTHALIAIAAAQAGKHVYVEKPVSHNIWEGRQMVAAARQYDCIMQCGTQSRSSRALKEAVDFVQSGELGEVLYAVGTCYKPRKPIGKLEKPLPIPSFIDYDLWCGPAEKRELFRPSLHYDWHWDFNTGNGDMGNQGIHQMDIARWFLGEDSLPSRVLSIGGRLGYEDAADTPNTQIAYFDYPAAPLLFETRGLPRSKSGQSDWGKSMDSFRGSRIGVVVQCEGGHVLIPNYSSATVFDRSGKVIKNWKQGGNHFENWLSAVAAGDSQLLNGEILEGHLSSALCHLGGISHQLGEKLAAPAIADRIKSDPMVSDSFERMAAHLRANDVKVDNEATITMGPWLELDPMSETFTNNSQANELLSRKQREPFVVPELV